MKSLGSPGVPVGVDYDNNMDNMCILLENIWIHIINGEYIINGYDIWIIYNIK